MVTLNLHSTELEELADALTGIATALDSQATEREQAWRQLTTFTDAESLLMGIHRLHRHNETLVETSNRIAQASRVLLQTAGAVKVLEGALNAVENITGYSPAMTVFLQRISQLGDLLDFMCAHQLDALCSPIASTPLIRIEDFGDLPAASIHEFNLMNAPPDVQRLAEDNPDMTLLEAGGGTLVAAIGDLDEATAVTTIVAGVGSSDPTQWQGNLDRARGLHQASGSATVMWVGYTAPASVGGAISDRTATAGAQELARFQETLAARNPEQRRVGIGHSYGSVVVGNAASKSAAGFDAVVLVGSPGAGVRHAREINAEVFAVTGVRDPIGFAATRLDGIHGTDPTSPWFGSTVWDSNSSHSGYWDDPTFMRDLGEVINR